MARNGEPGHAVASPYKVKIVQYLQDGQDQGVTKIAVMLARQCDLFVHFQRLWKMRVADLGAELNTERYMQTVYVNKRALYKELVRTPPRQPL